MITISANCFFFFNLKYQILIKNRYVIELQTPPYGMLVDSSAPLVGNDRFEGFAIDIIHELSLMLGFKYEFRVQEDKDYGGINKVTKEWTGMIRALQDDVRKPTLKTFYSFFFSSNILYETEICSKLIWP